MKIEIGYIARVEGEGAVKLKVKDGRVEMLELRIWEPPRFFEGFLVGRQYDEVPDIVARICGICPISHMATAIRALEKALDIVPPPETVAMRQIMAWSQVVASHLVHLYMLALPDYHRLHSAAEMLPGFHNELARMLRMKEVLNDLNAAFGGRALHPIAMTVAGFTKPPGREITTDLIRRLVAIRSDALETLQMVADLQVPSLENRTEYVALDNEEGYALNEGRLVSNRGLSAPEDHYLEYFAEEQVGYANAKRTVIKGRGPLMVGALARLNIKFASLNPRAREAAAMVGFEPPADNPFHNNLAQAIEIVHGIETCIELLERLPAGRAWVDIRPRAGAGTAITEAPRGLLLHSYVLDQRGVVEQANIVTPTAHNFYGLEENLRRLVATHLDEPQDEIALKCEMLVRAYDPCFSCSVH